MASFPHIFSAEEKRDIPLLLFFLTHKLPESRRETSSPAARVSNHAVARVDMRRKKKRSWRIPPRKQTDKTKPTRKKGFQTVSRPGSGLRISDISVCTAVSQCRQPKFWTLGATVDKTSRNKTNAIRAKMAATPCLVL